MRTVGRVTVAILEIVFCITIVAFYSFYVVGLIAGVILASTAPPGP